MKEPMVSLAAQWACLGLGFLWVLCELFAEKSEDIIWDKGCHLLEEADRGWEVGISACLVALCLF